MMKRWAMFGICGLLIFEVGFGNLLGNDDPCAGCTLVGIGRQDQEYICAIDWVTCVNRQCELSDACIVPPRSYTIRVTTENVFGDPSCSCEAVPLGANRCETIQLGVYRVQPSGIVPPCSRLVIYIDLIGRESYITYLLDCSGQEKVVIDRETLCPASHSMRHAYQPEEGCCPKWVPVLPVPSVEVLKP
ncbi:hypothetical protein [Fischerella thermalis]|uniref:hypothetical protein n=1 Tax=Fischerella thermalis TaxID=372787 RepID=UPI0011AFAA8A|nr:hypothetical protein [Fischerella thermalis]